IETEQQTLARAVRGRLLAWQALLNDHLALIDAQRHFGQTDYTFVIEGWVPRRELPNLEAALQAEVGEEVLVTELPLSAEERKRAPVMFDNPGVVRPFEPLLRLLGLPRYGAFDPTPLMAVFLPLFFGMILGDIAYGAILLGVMIYLRQRFRHRPMLRALAEVLIMGAAWSIVFGFIYGEFLGAVGEELGLHPLWFGRGPENLERLFLLTIGIGAGHVVLGLALGLWSAWARHSRHEAIEKAAMLAALAALFLLAGVVADFLPPFMFTPALAGLVVGLAILIYGQGGIGVLLAPLELLSTVGNILSYLRIAAIGLSSVYLAEVAGALAGAAGNLWVGVIIASFFHALNVLLGAFSPTIHSLRLHYVEFFSKFYQGGGQAFRPFARSVTSQISGT
ncbi:MAG: V-type ATPase 116kDa subunit family protein, partial [Anaerolineae bacterium]